ncbi:F0F1 ATP synthase subunit A [Sphaerobacter sp.]|uniref:F0F1 ATP synthase subunit A n=1 Tax=Sphaerobacter sp. TaxID=2099654 RepID=UPI001D710BD3|nr:F0F1 ATP synthase subunit A [Sphaerobacter sp.]MBX5446061.1 F0F1 ATP synthase subunit A [Sphaerobacter sp.]
MEVHVAVAPETLWSVSIPGTGLTLNITNSFLTMLIVMAALVIVGAVIARRATLVPGFVQSVFEMAAEFILGMVEGAAGKRAGRTIFPLVGGLFIFIIVSNYTGLLPGIGTIGYVDEHGHLERSLFRPPSADLNMTLAMAVVTFLVVQVAGIRAHGVGGRIKHMANPPFLFPIEVIGEFSRIISLSFRLFGNIFAGEVLLTVMYAMANAIKITVVGLLIPVIFLYLEVLFGFIQALVFALLTLIYIVLATADGHDDHAEDAVHEAEGSQHAVTPATSGGD